MAAGILLKSWEKSDPVPAGINDLIKESGIPTGKLFREHPDLLDLLATHLSWHAARTEDEVQQYTAKYADALLAEFDEPP